MEEREQINLRPYEDEKTEIVMLSPIRSAQGRLFACRPERSEGPLKFAQGKIGEASLYFLENKCWGPSLRSGRHPLIALFTSPV